MAAKGTGTISTVNGFIGSYNRSFDARFSKVSRRRGPDETATDDSYVVKLRHEV